MKTSTRQVDAYYYLLRATQVLLLSATTFTVPDAGRWDPRFPMVYSPETNIEPIDLYEFGIVWDPTGDLTTKWIPCCIPWFNQQKWD